VCTQNNIIDVEAVTQGVEKSNLGEWTKKVALCGKVLFYIITESVGHLKVLMAQ
jgi:hypothetical protein